MILVIDNYDSFTYNLVQYIQQIGEEIAIVRNDQVTVEDIERLQPDSILLSPGPGNPRTAGICLDVVKRFHQETPILGVCLGHQIIAEAFGGIVKKARQPVHGKVSNIEHDHNGVYANIPSPLQVTRYHSLVVDKNSLPSSLGITAQSEDGEIMGIRHKQYRVEGVQFHPEAILTDYGLEMVQNFFKKDKVHENKSATFSI